MIGRDGNTSSAPWRPASSGAHVRFGQAGPGGGLEPPVARLAERKRHRAPRPPTDGGALRSGGGVTVDSALCPRCLGATFVVVATGDYRTCRACAGTGRFQLAAGSPTGGSGGLAPEGKPPPPGTSDPPPRSPPSSPPPESWEDDPWFDDDDDVAAALAPSLAWTAVCRPVPGRSRPAGQHPSSGRRMRAPTTDTATPRPPPLARRFPRLPAARSPRYRPLGYRLDGRRADGSGDTTGGRAA